jgi:hypothetical protein
MNGISIENVRLFSIWPAPAVPIIASDRTTGRQDHV